MENPRYLLIPLGNIHIVELMPLSSRRKSYFKTFGAEKYFFLRRFNGINKRGETIFEMESTVTKELNPYFHQKFMRQTAWRVL